MKKIKYVKGDATSPQGSDVKIIAHICNDTGGWGSGFVLALSERWDEPEKAYRFWYRNAHKNNFSIGNIQIVPIDSYLYVANMIGQRSVPKAGTTGVLIRYYAVENCLKLLAVQAIALGASVHMPRIGCGLAGGKWERIEPLIKKTLLENDIDVYVYDL